MYAYSIVPSARWIYLSTSQLNPGRAFRRGLDGLTSAEINHLVRGTMSYAFSRTNSAKYSTKTKFYKHILSQRARWVYPSTGVYHCDVITECEKVRTFCHIKSSFDVWFGPGYQRVLYSACLMWDIFCISVLYDISPMKNWMRNAWGVLLSGIRFDSNDVIILQKQRKTISVWC